MTKNPGAYSRLVASKAVGYVADQGYSSERALQAAGIEDIAGHKDAAFARSIFLGTIRWYQQMDSALGLLLDKPLPRKNRDIHYLLMTALFQLAKTDIARHGIVSETVNAVAMTGKKWAKGLVNGVLRNFIRQQQDVLARLNTSDSTRTSHPDWFLEILKQAWPENWEQITSENNRQAPMALRVNSIKTSTAAYLEKLAASGIHAEKSSLSENGILLAEPCAVEQLPGFSEGLVSIQDIAPQLAAGLLDIHEGQSILDACAAPGGKTAHILETAKGMIDLTAIEIDPVRLKRITQNLARLDLQATVLQGDTSLPETWWDGTQYDRILIDAPCSGTGVIRRHPDIKLLRRPSDIAQLAAQQLRIMKALWPLLKTGGKLVYATCSVLPEENENLVAKFLATEDDANELIIDVNYGHTRRHGIQILPGEQMMDGFFYACLQKK